MALSIKDEETDRLARELAKVTGESLTESIRHALAEQLKRVKRGHRRQPLADRLVEIGKRCAALRVEDELSADEIIGYDDRGLPR